MGKGNQDIPEGPNKAITNFKNTGFSRYRLFIPNTQLWNSPKSETQNPGNSETFDLDHVDFGCGFGMFSW